METNERIHHAVVAAQEAFWAKIAEAFYYLHTQDRSCWTHDLQLTPFSTKPSY